SDFEAHPEDDDDEDPEEDPVDYLADGGDDGDDEEESSEDDDMDVEADEEEEEEEHLAPADSVVVAPTATYQAPSAEETEPFETDESAATPPPHPAYPPPPSPIRSLGYRAAMIRLRDEAASTSSPPLQLPSASRREDRLEVTLPPRKRLDIALGPRYETERHLLAGRLNMLFRDRRAHAYIRHLMETEARMSREAWVRATDASDLVHGEVMSLRTTVLGQMRQTVISELLRIDHRRSTEISELRTALQGQVTSLQGQVTTLQAQVTILQGQQGLAGGPTQSELPEEAGGNQETINAISVTNAQLQAMINQGVTSALAARDALRSTNGDDSHNSRTGALKELPIFPNGVKEWSSSFTSATALSKTK
nr:hypothetical protein [Tanacetum cinerariifolium]